MPKTLRLEEIEVAAFETGAPAAFQARYTPHCCTDDMSGCATGPETGCVDTIATGL